MSRDYRLYLEDIQISCRKLLRYAENLDFDLFASDEVFHDAVVYNLVVLGEAAKQVPPHIRKRYPEVQWRKIAGLRDISVHRYFSLDEEIIWDILQNEVRPLLDKLDQIMDEEEND
ncbi:HepT-like ribonuclease domain-containing protein [Methanothrix harundinacea]|jgi:uncharacterized protein with HEPN domain|uniref:Nucleotidyltransferase n=1 Tax=Methanothrix harundinacea (strain 6Ac) TaxID=1110509 RepID=G7WM20_METH6|nr:DUF86 domain-containing protein [Methanothrix harundinacea]AET64395.1 hypothetical protein Mhar_1026 [Methanothrix harundinacea 6Ac]